MFGRFSGARRKEKEQKDALSPRVAEMLEQARALLEAGRWPQAESLYRELIAESPGLARAHYNLGLVLEEMGRFGEAEQALRRATETAPEKAIPHNGLGEFLYRRGRPGEAAQCFHRAEALAPDNALHPCNLAAALNALGRHREAVRAALRAIRLQSDLPEAHNNHGIARAALGERALAEQAFRYALGLRPGFAACATNLLALLLEQDRVGEAEKVLGRLEAGLRELPGPRTMEAEIHRRRGREVEAEAILEPLARQGEERAVRALIDLYREQGRLEEALALREAHLRPGDAHHWLELARLRLHLMDGTGALAACEEALRLRPEDDEGEYLAGIVHGTLGSRERAEACYRSVLRRDPTHAAAWRQLAELAGGADEAAALLAGMEAGPPDGAGEAAIEIHFARGRLLSLCGEYEQAFREYQAGNRLKAGELGTEETEETLRFMERTMEVFDREFFRRHPHRGSGDERPVFVVGMPRSGSTLVERILSGHSAVAGRGERKALVAALRAWRFRARAQRPYPECLEGMDGEALAAIAADYLARMAGGGEPEPARLVDKMLFNFQYLGLVALLFPNARIVHCRRDPLDTCLSCYFQNFSEGNAFSYDLESLGRFYRAYRRLMEHWRQVLPLPLHEVDYEALTEHPEREARALIGFLGLEWEPGCLETGREGGAVVTASVHQVRRPIYRDARGRWRPYEPWLGPLLQALGDCGQRMR